MRFPFRFSDMRIRTKLLVILALIVTIFSTIVLTEVVSFQRIENVLGRVISDDMSNVMTNALTERELTSIVADLNLLLGTFFENDTHLQNEGARLLGATRALAGKVARSELEAPLELFGQQMEFLLQQCREVNIQLRLVGEAAGEITAGFDRLDEVIAEKLIEATLVDEDTDILQQLAILLVGYRQSLLEIGKQHAERWPEAYYAPLDTDDDPMIVALNDLDYYLRTLISGDRQIVDLGQGVINHLQTYKSGLLALNAAMVELKKQMLAVEGIRFQATEIIEKFDRDVVQAIKAANTKVLSTFRVAEATLIMIALILIVTLVVLTMLFFENIIEKPMDDIRKGIKALRSGNLDARIDLQRNDEWHVIEEALNLMAAELSTSYADLKMAQSFVANIIDSMPSVLVGVDPSGRVTQWNRQAEKVTGHSPGYALNKPLDQVFTDLSDQLSSISTAIRERRVINSPGVARKVHQGIRFEDITIYPLVADGIQGAVVRVDDVTERVRLEEMMIQSEKMLSVGGLAAGMAHEINNPLAGMLQTADVIANRMLDQELPANRRAAEQSGISMKAIYTYMDARGIPRMLKSIRDSGQRASAIVSNMLSFSRKSENIVSNEDMGTLLDRVLELLQTDYDMKKHYDFKQIQIVREYHSGVPPVTCEAGKIQQVFMNILKNGAEAMAEVAGPPRFVLRIKEDGQWVRVEIEDNGPGMDDITRRRVFEPFFTTKPVGQGTGLGMSVSYFIVTDGHGGEMSVESVDSGGTRFIVRLRKPNRTS